MTRQRQLDSLEAQYAELLLTALKRCAAGKSGLFGQNDAIIAGLHVQMRQRLRSPDASTLLQLGEEINAM